MRGGGLNMEIRRLVMDFLFLPGEDVCFLFFSRMPYLERLAQRNRGSFSS